VAVVKRRLVPLACAIVLLTSPLHADFRELAAIPVEAELEAGLARIAADAFERFPTLKPGHLSLTVVDITDERAMKRGSFAGDVPYHPASVVKMFFLASAHREAEKGRLRIDAPLEAALSDMIVESSNDATSYVVDRITRTTSGPELRGRAWKEFVHRRNLMNRWYASMGYDISANGKTWCENVYGRERELLGANRENRNRVTSEGVAALALWIARGRAVSPGANEAMLALMKRPLVGEGEDTQVKDFGGEALTPGSKLWSKAGWTSEVRHDAMIVELPNRRRYVAVILTRWAGEEEGLLPWLSGRVVEMMTLTAAVPGPPAPSR
jgi:beta-lactamase class A